MSDDRAGLHVATSALLFARFLSCLFFPARSTDASVVQDFPLTQYFPLDVDVSDDGRHVFASFNGFDGDGCTVALWDRRSSRVLHSLSGHEQVLPSRSRALSSFAILFPWYAVRLIPILDARSTLLVRTPGGQLVLPAAARRRRRPVWRLVLQGRHGARLGPDAGRLRGHAAARGLRGADLDSVRAVRAASVRFVLLSCARAACLGLISCVSSHPVCAPAAAELQGRNAEFIRGQHARQRERAAVESVRAGGSVPRGADAARRGLVTWRRRKQVSAARVA